MAFPGISHQAVYPSPSAIGSISRLESVESRHARLATLENERQPNRMMHKAVWRDHRAPPLRAGIFALSHDVHLVLFY